ncbi:family 2 glycosyl transferase [Wenjunlia vitaminophila]|uniref:Family 2 glycosyl transferase n=1 Tax=Wenjunlia vitaminophila TaxID=76728 RepID=A0A0T6LRP7_WENVI|nr:family 2 glycosyl transferase [Wenjunlia vitaminophila]
MTAVIVAHDGARWLPQALSGLVGQERPVQSVIAADTGSADYSANLLQDALGSERVIHLGRRSGFGTAVTEAVRTAGPVDPDGLPYLARRGGWDPVARNWDDDAPKGPPPEPVQWLWLLHDDCAPEPDALLHLLRVADSSPSVAVVGPKLRSWYDRRQLLEAGVSIARSGRRWTGLDRREQDQGQHDQVRQVLAVSSAGMLVRRDVWEELGGFDRNLPLMRDDVDFCWRVQAAGHRVMVAPDAVLRHAEAAARERRPIAAAPDRPYRVDKAGAVFTLLANSSTRVLPYVLLRLLLGTLLRALGYLVAKVPGQALDEVAGLSAVLMRPGRIISARRARSRGGVPASELRPLFPPPGATVRLTVEQLAGSVVGRAGEQEASAGRHGAVESGPGDEDADFLEVENFARLKRLARKPAPVLFASLLLVSLVACRDLYGGGALFGGSLLPVPGGASDLWTRVTDGWHTVGTGGTTSAPPYLAVLAVLATVLLGKVSLAVAVLLVGSVPLAGLTAYFASRPLVESRALRAWGSVSYALLPAVTGALATGRLGTAVLAVLLPLMARAAVAAAGLHLSPGALERGARPGWRGTWALALLLTVTTAFTPVVWLIAVVLAVTVVVVRVLGGHRALLVPLATRFAALLALPMLLLAPWSLGLVTDPSRFLVEAGLPYPGDDPAGAGDLVLLNPGGPGTLPGMLMVGVVLAGLGALLRTERRVAIVSAWAAALVGLLLAVPANGAEVTAADGMASGQTWSGPAVLLYALGLLVAAVVGAEGLKDRVAEMSFGWRQPAAALVAVAAAAAPLCAGGAWLLRGAGDPLDRRDPVQVPAFIAEESATRDQARTLVIGGDSASRISYTLVRGSGAKLGDAETVALEGTDKRLSGVVSDLLAGSGADQAGRLAGYAVRFVLVQDGPARAEMSQVLDSTPGILRMSQENGTALWRVDRTVARITVQTPGEPEPLAVAAGPVDARTEIPAGEEGRVLRIADAADGDWRATLDGRALKPVTVDGWAQGFELPAEGGVFTLRHETPFGHTAWLWTQGFGVLVVLVLALPGRRSEVDDDLPEPAAVAAVPASNAVDGEGRRARRLRAQAEAQAEAQGEVQAETGWPADADGFPVVAAGQDAETGDGGVGPAPDGGAPPHPAAPPLVPAQPTSAPEDHSGAEEPGAAPSWDAFSRPAPARSHPPAPQGPPADGGEPYAVPGSYGSYPQAAPDPYHADDGTGYPVPGQTAHPASFGYQPGGYPPGPGSPVEPGGYPDGYGAYPGQGQEYGRGQNGNEYGDTERRDGSEQ